ncbi:MAG: UDP-N-acetylglucosamine 2-epimerase (non-hydrolyzing) [Trueperaceae bacterium]|nr:UDP-N-acetylglucosamine 2-epimerase (non-hydrolyzing) [Trueperaceae bacterium]
MTKNTNKRVCVAFGTRPEASKMAPVVYGLREQPGLTPLLLVTGQHREQLDSMLKLFGLRPDADLNVMTARQSLADLLGRIVPETARVLRELSPDYVLVHGDTLTTFAVALAAFFEAIPVAHVEAGLRSFDLREPFPEEANRRLTDVITDLDLPPTPWAKQNLLREGKSSETMVVTGNTAVDAVHIALDKAKLPEHLPPRPLVAVTMHRRENLPMMKGLAETLADLARQHPEFTFVYPVHLNPAVREAVYPALESVPNVILDEPYDYLAMLALLQAAELVITDSGGIQEEGTALGVPVVVLRNVTERPEGVEVGALKLAGNDPARVAEVVGALLADEGARALMRRKRNPYGDGRAGQRVARAVAWRLGLAERPEDWS